MRRQWARRGRRGGYRHCRGPWARHPVQARQAREKSERGRPCRGSSPGNRNDEIEKGEIVMRYSEMFLPTVREVPSDAEVISHQLMIRAGLIRKLTAGIYSILPLGYRTVKKVEQIIRDEMDAAGA